MAIGRREIETGAEYIPKYFQCTVLAFFVKMKIRLGNWNNALDCSLPGAFHQDGHYCFIFNRMRDLNTINDNQDMESKLKILSEATIPQPHWNDRKKRIALQYYNITFDNGIRYRTYIFHKKKIHQFQVQIPIVLSSPHARTLIPLFDCLRQTRTHILIQ